MPPPQVYEQLINAITERYEGMSKGFHKIARFLVRLSGGEIERHAACR